MTTKQRTLRIFTTRPMPSSELVAAQGVAQPRVEPVPQVVPEEIDGEHGEEDGEPGKGGDPPRAAEVEPTTVEHPPPRHDVRLHAQTEEGQGGLEDDHVRHGEDGY